MKKIYLLSIILFSVSFVAILLLIYHECISLQKTLSSSKRSALVVIPTLAPTTSPNDWKTYKNSELSVEFSYPSGWYLTEDPDFGIFISNKPIANISSDLTPNQGQIILKILFFHSAFENGLGKTEHQDYRKTTIISDIKLIAKDNNRGVIFNYQKSDKSVEGLISIAESILSTFKFNNP